MTVTDANKNFLFEQIFVNICVFKRGVSVPNPAYHNQFSFPLRCQLRKVSALAGPPIRYKIPCAANWQVAYKMPSATTGIDPGPNAINLLDWKAAPPPKS